MSPGDVSEKNFGTVLEEGEWSAGIAHARGGAGVVAALLSAGQGLEEPGLSADGVGDALGVGPLEGGSNDAGVAVDVLRVTVARCSASGLVGKLGGQWRDKSNWLDVVIEGEVGRRLDDHVIPIDSLSVVRWVRNLLGDVKNLSLASELSGTGTGGEGVGRLLAVSGAHDDVVLDDGTAAEVRAGSSLEGHLPWELTVVGVGASDDELGWAPAYEVNGITSHELDSISPCSIAPAFVTHNFAKSEIICLA